MDKLTHPELSLDTLHFNENNKDPNLSKSIHELEDSFLQLKNLTTLTIVVSLLSSIIQYLSLGLVIGLYNSPITLIGFLLTLSFQEISESLTLGYALSKIRFSNTIKAYSLLVFFSLLTPCGILLGGWMNTSLGYSKSFMIGFSAGNFVYVTCCVMIDKEFTEKRKNMTFYIFYWMGISVMVILWIIEHSQD